VGVEDPLAPQRDLLVLAVRDRAVATSTTMRRRWLRDGVVRHHLIDPRNGAPAATGVLAATVVAPTTAGAETLAKAALLLGPDAGLAFLDRQPDAAGALVCAGGRVLRSNRLGDVASVSHVARVEMSNG
jgi:thiamine biosynthesis lipoprotein